MQLSSLCAPARGRFSEMRQVRSLRQTIPAARSHPGKPMALAKREKVRRKLIERASRQRAQPLGGVGFEQVRAAVDRMYRLAPAGFARVVAHKFFVRLAQTACKVSERLV